MGVESAGLQNLKAEVAGTCSLILILTVSDAGGVRRHHACSYEQLQEFTPDVAAVSPGPQPFS